MLRSSLLLEVVSSEREPQFVSWVLLEKTAWCYLSSVFVLVWLVFVGQGAWLPFPV